MRNGSGTRSTSRRALIAAAAALLLAGAVVRDDTEVNADGRLAFVYAVVDHGTLAVDRYVRQQPLIVEDLALVDGHYYMAKPPLQSLLALPVYAVARLVLPAAGMDSWGWRWLLTLVTSGVAFAVLLLVVRALLLAIGQPRPAATHGALIATLGTPLLVYASMFMGHALAAVLLAFVVLAAVSGRSAFYAGLAYGGLVSTELLPAAAATIPFGVLIVDRLRRRAPRALLAAFAGAVLGAAPLAIYLTAIFGSPLENMYAHIVPEGPRAAYAAGAYRLPQLEAIVVTLFSPQQGFFVFAPLALFGILRLRRFVRGTVMERRAALICVAAFAVSVVTLASFALWYDGAQYGPRYLAPLMPLLAWPIAGLAARERTIIGIASATPHAIALVAHQPLLNGTAFETTYAIVAGRVMFGYLDPSLPGLLLASAGVPAPFELGAALVIAGAAILIVAVGRRGP